MSENNLLPCPFCGGEAKLIGFSKGKGLLKKAHYTDDKTKSNGFFVKCLACGCDTGMSLDENFAIAAWNKRTCSCKNREV